MGFGKIVKGAGIGSALGMGPAGAIKGGLLGGGKNLLFGKKDPGRKDEFIGLEHDLALTVGKARGIQRKALDRYEKEIAGLDDDPKAAADREVARRVGIAKALGQANKMRMRDRLAQSGLQRSAAGLRQMRGIETGTQKAISGARADAPLIQQQMTDRRIGRLGQLSGGVNQVLMAPGAQRSFVPGRESRGRSGGLMGLGMGLAGAFAAAKMGGSPTAGFGAGMGAGKMMSNF